MYPSSPLRYYLVSFLRMGTSALERFMLFRNRNGKLIRSLVNSFPCMYVYMRGITLDYYALMRLIKVCVYDG